jgi:DNA-binding CsgD family transcriptional regulator
VYSGGVEAQEPLGQKLDILIRLMGASLTRDMSKRQAIELLGRAGLDRRTIADICGTSPHAVSVVLSQARRRSKPDEGGTASADITPEA